ncbi:FAD-dependent oxidoreductase [Noviherbaspirillum sp. Root189]|uniref:FAD-dependent oxidoreductase n=1 Tax=Noviherbaspirillum sp. Root189 TaxID=1736487 RepID=UPI00070C03F1|nr:FAD-dependent oxidoreductase [Noviherbaspirillum sp. Root189]KRB72963.1 FAD-binding monooxygenase [Noviherbaspirillum sp. Root189]
MTQTKEINTTTGYELPSYPFEPPPDLHLERPRRYRIAIVGGGLAGLTAACDLAVRGIETVLLDDDNTVGVRGASSRGMVYAQKTLEIMERLGIYRRIHKKGITWSVGRTMTGGDEVYSFDRASDNASQQSAFINLQQFYLEWYLVDRITELGKTDLRWNNKVTGAEHLDNGVRLSVETPAGNYQLDADWVIDAAGINSAIREGFGLDTHAARSVDRWCICDVRFKKPLPVERWTWVEAPFNQNRAVWQHLMADNVWRLDYQMDPDADAAQVSQLDVAAERVRAHVGADTEFEMVWVGPWQYRTQLLDSFRLGRIFFAGDVAHVVSPFGARGGNSGIQDADNLSWKLALVVNGHAPETLLDSYHHERYAAAVENIKVTSRTSRFLAPTSLFERIMRKAVLDLAREFPFARALVNTGRLSVPNDYPDSPVVQHGGHSVPNLPIGLPDRTVSNLVELSRSHGTAYLGICFQHPGPEQLDALRELTARYRCFAIYLCNVEGAGLPTLRDDGALARAVGAECGFALLRPDLHVAGRLQHVTAPQAEALLKRALGY